VAEAAFSIVAEKVRQRCFDALTPAEQTAALFDLVNQADRALAEVR
jgi:hypothetical protein